MDMTFETRSVLTILFKHSFKMAIVFFLTILLGLAFISTQKPTYTARASFLVKFGQGAVPNITSGDESRPNEFSYSDRAELMQSYINIIQSYDLISQAIETVGFEKVFPANGTDKQTSAQKEKAKQQQINAFIKNNIEIVIANRSNVIELSVSHKTGDIAYQLTDRILNSFLDKQGKIYNASPAKFLQQRLEEATVARDDAQEKFRLFKQTNRIADIDGEITQLLQEKRDLSNISFESRASDQTNLTNLITDLETKKAELEATYRADSVVLKKINDSLNVAQAQLRSVQRGQSVSTRGLSVTTRQKELNDRISFLEDHREEFDALEKTLESAEQKEKYFKERVEDSRVNDALNQENISRITVVDKPIVPTVPSEKSKKLILLAFLMLGAFLAISIAFIAEMISDKISTPHQLEKICSIPVIASFSKGVFK